MGSGKGGKKVTVGFRYYMGMHMLLCHGPVDEVQEIRVGGRTAWDDGAYSNQQVSIDAEELFGGEGREGGIKGDVDVEFGGGSQGKNDYLQSHLTDVPGFRGLLGIVLRQVYLGNIPRFKPWAVTAKREPAGWTGAPSGFIGEDANPAHILFECITNTDYGIGDSPDRIDTTSFTDAANTLASESFGLSFLWQNPGTDIQGFIGEVLRYIDGSLYVDPATAKWRLKLHRDDYTVGNLAVLDQSNVVEVHDFSRPGWGDLTSEIVITYTDGEAPAPLLHPSWKKQAISQQNQAAVRAQGGRVVSQTHQYPAITTHALANKMLARDLHQASQPLARVEHTLLASEGGIRPGDVRVWKDPDYGVDQLVIRVVEVDYGTVRDGRIRIKAVEDAFATRDAVFADPTPTDWIEPANEPAAAPYRRLSEATYYQIALELGDSDTLLGEIADTAGYLLTQAVRPSGDAFDYEVEVDAGAGYQRDTDGDFCPSAELAAAVAGDDTSLTLDLATAEDLDLVETDTWAYLESEIIAVRAIDTAAGTVTVDRGVIDTTPRAHAAGARIWFGQDYESTSQTEYTDGEQIDVKLLPTTSLGTLDIASAPSDSITFDARFIRPYAPGQIRFNGLDFPAAVDGVPTLAWAHRDRTQQTAGLIDQDAGDIGPEPGTTYTLRIYDGADTLVRTETGISGTQYTYDEATELADGGPFVTLTWQLEAVRDGWTSWQYQERTADLYGYGRRYGEAYGGLA